jgi:hypothetical protein
MVEGRTDFCASHNKMNRSISKMRVREQEKREMILSKPQTPRQKPNIVSEKRKELNKEYAALRPEYLLEHPVCEVKLIGCEGASVEIHHTASGSNKVAHLNDVSTWKATCGSCHKVLHDKLSARQARELGLKV